MQVIIKEEEGHKVRCCQTSANLDQRRQSFDLYDSASQDPSWRGCLQHKIESSCAVSPGDPAGPGCGAKSVCI